MSLARMIATALLLVGVVSGSAVAQQVDPIAQAEALARAGDVDGAAAIITQQYNASPANLSGALERVAAANPSVAGPVLNVAVRTIGQTTGTSGLQTVLQTAVAATLDGVNSAAGSTQNANAPSQSELAENIAVNVRQAIVVVAGDDENAQNTLLASARAGVQASDLAQAATTTTDTTAAATTTDTDAAQEALDSLTGQLVGILNSRLTSAITDDEAATLTSTATTNTEPAPITITTTTPVDTPVVTTPVVDTPVVPTVIIPVITTTTVLTPPITNENRTTASPF